MPELDRFEFDTDKARVDREYLWRFLSREAYWGRWRDRTTVEAQLDGAWRIVGCYERATNTMVGYARAISDGIAFAYLADVFIDPDRRGEGLGTQLVATMIDGGPGAHFTWMLHTSDAHGLYQKFGFTPPSARVLERPGGAPPE